MVQFIARKLAVLTKSALIIGFCSPCTIYIIFIFTHHHHHPPPPITNTNTNTTTLPTTLHHQHHHFTHHRLRPSPAPFHLRPPSPVSGHHLQFRPPSPAPTTTYLRPPPNQDSLIKIPKNPKRFPHFKVWISSFCKYLL